MTPFSLPPKACHHGDCDQCGVKLLAPQCPVNTGKHSRKLGKGQIGEIDCTAQCCPTTDFTNDPLTWSDWVTLPLPTRPPGHQAVAEPDPEFLPSDQKKPKTKTEWLPVTGTRAEFMTLYQERLLEWRSHW